MSAAPPLAQGAWVVTGAASGFGREFARRLAQRGAPLVLLDRDADGLAATQLVVRHAKAHAEAVDVTDPRAVQAAIARGRDAVGPVAHCVHSAGILKFGRVESMPFEDFRRLVDVNYLGSVAVAQAALPHLRASGQRGRAVMLFVASIGGLRAGPEVGAYCASKFAVVGMAQALRDEMRATGVDVRALCPPPGDTPMLRAQPTLPPIYRVSKKLSAEVIVDRALAALDAPGFEILVDAQSRALVALSRLAPALSEWVVGRVAG